MAALYAGIPDPVQTVPSPFSPRPNVRQGVHIQLVGAKPGFQTEMVANRDRFRRTDSFDE
ncbi:MAG TPA: hypothetical protein VEJ67_10385 [Candidatus Cybelea sp.]|nr:hypothetical protein [Candidatus Cybelea sp.]